MNYYLVEYYDNYSLIKSEKSHLEFTNEFPRYTIWLSKDSLGQMIRGIQDMKANRAKMSPNQSSYLDYILESHPEYVI